MNFVRQKFGFETGLTAWSHHWHVVAFSSNYHFKSGKLRGLIDGHLGSDANLVQLTHMVHGPDTAFSLKTNHPYIYRIVVGGTIDMEALKERVRDLESAIETMQNLHKPEEWVEEGPCESS